MDNQRKNKHRSGGSSDKAKAVDEKYCGSCGEIIKIKAEICPKCGVRSELQNLLAEENKYFSENHRYTSNLDELNIEPGMSNITLEITNAGIDCFEATGTHSQLEDIISINCNGQFQ